MVMFYLVLMDYSNPEPNAKPNITHFVEFVDVLKMFLLNFGPKLRGQPQERKFSSFGCLKKIGDQI